MKASTKKSKLALLSCIIPLGIVGTIAFSFAKSAVAAPSPQGMQGDYIGTGISSGVTSGGHGSDNGQVGGDIQGRVAITHTPLSVRGSFLFDDKTTATIPTITYDIPIAKNTNLYTGAGYSFIGRQGDDTPLGNRNSVVIDTGVETAINKNIVAFGDGKLGLDAYKNSDADAVSFQLGVGYKF
ncbi:outer membrane beta-barrel protein [Nostoc sp. FACHB-152]|uniref:outer membrane beta-barrel protein n=1 Tax=unclassified Nostoc TaxID=2593658 RepID=UPI001685C78E|nr:MULTISPECIES: outer membrane beta-barrel protein [unclassified Nostoc]MBD2451950.1 outer membrane beta-barrel protein [Nostoc sp. FACHB-152]MBD2473042.1 outer membrane beta-barrel protein [Nostoc sp. FACHB-145]